MSDAATAERPKSENGVLFLGPWGANLEKLVQDRWPGTQSEPLTEGLTRLDLSHTPRGSCPGFNDAELLEELSQAGVVFGFFCDGVNGAEGVRVFERGRQRDRRHATWDAPEHPDPLAWPIGSLAVTLRLPIEAVTRVDRPPRPAINVAAEGLLSGNDPTDPDLLRKALEVMGAIDHPQATAAIVRHLTNPDWVTRFHAARSYARLDRGQGEEQRPTLQSLMSDEDESVREALLRGVLELLPAVEFQQASLHRQIDAVVAAGLEDEDEDVRAAAEQAQALRKQLLG
jgi:hypothetical protein